MSVCICVCVEAEGRLIELNFRRPLFLLGRGLTSMWMLEDKVLRIDFFFFACHELMTLWSRNCSWALCCSMIFFNVSRRLLFRCWRIWWWRKLRKFRRRINKPFEVSRTKGTDNRYLVKHFTKRSWQHTVWHWWSLCLCG